MIDIGFNIEDNIHLIMVDYRCPSCGNIVTKKFNQTLRYRDLRHNRESLIDFIDIHLSFDQLEELEQGKTVSFTLFNYCGISCQNKYNTELLNNIDVPCNYKDVPVKDNSEFVNEFGVLITGKTGVGKTYLAVQILKSFLFSNKNATYKFINSCELLYTMHSEFNKNKQEQSILSTCMEVDILVLDDLGSEKFSEWSTTQMYLLINYRHENKKTTVVTSNLKMNEIKEHLNSRISSRLASYKRINIEGKDRRL